MIEDLKLFNGDYGVVEKDTDFILTEGDIDGLPTLFQQDDIFFEYNQNANSWSKLSCTIFNAFGAVSDLWNYEFLLNQQKEMNDISYTQGRIQGYGRSTSYAVDLVRNWWNGKPELVEQYGKVASYRINMRNDELVNRILDKNYTICRSFEGNADYILDYSEDGILDNAKFGKKIYGHSVGLRKIDGKKCIKDNYKGRKYNGRPTNIYELKPTCRELINGGTYRVRGYLFTKVKEDNYDELIRLEKVRVLCNNTLEANSTLWKNTNDKTLQKKLHETNERIRNNQLKYIEENLIKLR